MYIKFHCLYFSTFDSEIKVIEIWKDKLLFSGKEHRRGRNHQVLEKYFQQK